MGRIITLTVNPAIDKSTTVAGMSPSNKLYFFNTVGDGISASRVLKEQIGIDNSHKNKFAFPI